MQPVVIELTDVEGIVDLEKKSALIKEPIVVSLQEGRQLVAMTPEVLESLLYCRAYLEEYAWRD